MGIKALSLAQLFIHLLIELVIPIELFTLS